MLEGVDGQAGEGENGGVEYRCVLAFDEAEVRDYIATAKRM